MDNEKKVLVIAYYWPPSGGAGVQRWLKMTKYLAKTGVKIHVLTVHPHSASYFQIDETLQNDVHPAIKVHYSSSFEPLNYYSKLVGKKNVPTAGFSNANTDNWKNKLLAKIRSNLFIPDPRIGWKKYAVKKALAIIKEEKITNIITTSPPHSAQLIGLKLKEKLKDKINWIVDFRDPWTDIYYYPLFNNSKWSHRKNLALEKKVIENSDYIQTVSEGFKELFLAKTNKISSDKIQVISNAYDPDDFVHKANSKQSSSFLISYIGTVADNYDTEVFFDALHQLVKEYPKAPIHFKATGMVSNNLRDYIVELLGEKNTTFSSHVPHDKAIEAMLEAHILLLISPPTKGIVPGKAFEYMSSGRRIICIGKGDSGTIIENCKAGAAFNRNEKEKIYAYLKQAFLEYQEGIPFSNDKEELKKYAWNYKANLMREKLK